MEPPTLERLKELFWYDSANGNFIRLRTAPNKRYKKGEIAGHTDSKGYTIIGFDRKRYKAHRLAWLYNYGEWPASDIDHINGQPADNRMANLRLATKRSNALNRGRGARNKSGVVGVHFDNSKSVHRWRAVITAQGKKVHLGHFDHLDDAIDARKAAEKKYGSHPNHGARPSQSLRQN